MKRLLTVLSACLLLGLSLLVTLLVWLAGSNAGTRWLIDTLPRQAGVRLSVAQVQGRLADHLILSGVHLERAQQTVQLDRLELRWKPLALLGGTVGIQELLLQGVHISDASPPSHKPPSLAWPKPPHLATLVDLIVNRLVINDLAYQKLPQGTPLLVKHATARVTWQDGRLSAENVELRTPAGRASGYLVAGLAQPSVESVVAVLPASSPAGLSHIDLQISLKPSSGDEQVSGEVTVNARRTVASKAQQIKMAAMIGLSHDTILIRRFNLNSPQLSGRFSGEGRIRLTSGDPDLQLRVTVQGLDLASQTGHSTALSGTLALNGSLRNYRGQLALSNNVSGWQAVRLSSAFLGTSESIRLAPLQANLLGGSMSGQVKVGWRKGITASGTLKGRGLDPATIAAGWKGTVNLDLDGTFAKKTPEPARGQVKAVLLESRLHGQPLTGGLQAQFSGENLSIQRLLLIGSGFQITGSGELQRRLRLSARVSDLSRLLPGTGGKLSADGWIGRRQGQWSGELNSHGKELVARGVRLGAGDLHLLLGPGPSAPLNVQAHLQNLTRNQVQIQHMTLFGTGTQANHRIELKLEAPAGEARLAVAGSYREGVWQGNVLNFSGRDPSGPWEAVRPARLSVGAGKWALGPLELKGMATERIELSADLNSGNRTGSFRAQWRELNLARANVWLQEMRISGKSSGSLHGETLSGDAIKVAGETRLEGSLTKAGRTVTLRQGTLTLNGGPQRMQARLVLALADGSHLSGRFSSGLPARLALPEQGEFTMEGALPDLAQLQPWLPGQARLKGAFAARARGHFLPGQRFQLDGTAGLEHASIVWKRASGEMDLNLAKASLAIDWQGDTLSGTAELALAEYGQTRATFRLPLPARAPMVLDRRKPLQATLNGRFREKGIVSAMLPGMVQETHGDISADLQIGGSWEAPRLAGTVALTGAGAYVPSAGIRLSDLELHAALENDLVRIETFRAVSGPGYVRGQGQIRLQGWQVVDYRGALIGDRFLTVDVPELELQSSPQLTVEGTKERLKIGGNLRLPVLRITGTPYHAPVQPSKDVIVEGRTPAPAKSPPIAMDVSVHLALGDRVLVKMAGIDAQLGGELDLNLQELEHITSKGEIRVVKGRYQTHGVTLNIERGRLFYAGGPITRPTIDILALRKAGEVRAGVQVGGTLQAPVTKLYSEPPMPDVDVLAYIVLGHPLGGSSGEQAGILAQAAGALLSAGQSASLQDQIKSRLGLSTLEIQSGGAPTTHMGYKPMTATPPGTPPASQPSGLSQTMVTIGKYLTPQLYISYGRSLFTGGNLFMLRYDISRWWQLETQTGQESGVDLYYKIEFK